MEKTYKISVDFIIRTKSKELHEQYITLLEPALNILNKMYLINGHDYCEVQVSKYIEDDEWLEVCGFYKFKYWMFGMPDKVRIMDFKTIPSIHWLGNLDDIFEFFYDEDGNYINHNEEVIGEIYQLDKETKKI